MQTNLIRRQYDEVIAPRYDRDPQSVIGDSLAKALAQIRGLPAGDGRAPLRVLDVGVGTGRFLELLKAQAGRPVQPSGLDLSEKMVEVARARLPELTAVVDDAANLDAHFPPGAFDLVCTHFVTGFVPVRVLAPKIWGRLAEGGHWSFVGGTKAGFPEVQRKANARAVRWLFGGKSLDVDEFLCNPPDRDDLVRALEENGFTVRAGESFAPPLHFANVDEFVDFAYWGGWLTPYLESYNLHRASPLVRLLLNAFAFPMKDHHCIEIVLAQKIARQPPAAP